MRMIGPRRRLGGLFVVSCQIDIVTYFWDFATRRHETSTILR